MALFSLEVGSIGNFRRAESTVYPTAESMRLSIKHFFIYERLFLIIILGLVKKKKATSLKVTVLLMMIGAILPKNLSPVVEHVFTPSSVFGLHIDRCIALLHGILHLNQLAASNC